MYEYNNIRKRCSKLTKSRLYFYKNLFDPYKRSKFLNHQRLTKNTLQIIINEIFSTDVDENEYLIKKLNEEYDL